LPFNLTLSERLCMKNWGTEWFIPFTICSLNIDSVLSKLNMIGCMTIWLVFFFFFKGGKTHQTQLTNEQWGQPSLATIRNCRFVRITVIKENHVTWNNPLVVRKGAGYHSCQMPLGLGPLTCFLTSEEDELLAKQKQFYGILQADTIWLVIIIKLIIFVI